MAHRLKMVNWYNAGFPPINLNENIQAINDTVRAVLELEAENKRLRDALEECAEELNNLMAKNGMPVEGAAPKSDNLNSNVSVLDRARKALNPINPTKS